MEVLKTLEMLINLFTKKEIPISLLFFSELTINN